MMLKPTFLKSLSNLSLTTARKMGSYDIIISGGGMIGTSLAACLGKDPVLQSSRILIIEQTKEKEYAIGENFSNRVTSISPQTQQLFESVGVWDEMVKNRVHEVKRMQVWDACSESFISFDSEGMSTPISYIVENEVMLSTLKKYLTSLSTVDTVYNTKIKSYKLPNNGEDPVKVVLKDEKELTCSLLVGADGMHSGVRKAMNVHYLKWNYDQRAIVCTLTLSEAVHNIVAWQRFLPTGPIAFLPLSDDKVSLVWSTTQERAKQLLALPDDQFVDAVNDAFYNHKDNIDVINQALSSASKMLNLVSLREPPRQLPPHVLNVDPKSRASYPLGLGHATDYVKHRVALVGDAAHRVHPLAGLGANIGFGDVLCLAQHIRDSIYRGADIGSLHSLLQYQSERQLRNVPVLAATDGLYRMYSTDFLPVALIRSLGLQLVNSLPPLKSQLISMAAY